MSLKAARPVHYFQGQVLGISEFEDEQSYHAEARRRHNITHHDWGIVDGLELRVHDDKVIVEPGLAVDGLGRMVLLSDRRSIDHIDPESMEAFERPQVCCWIEYDRVLTSDDQGRPESRWDETPRLTLRYQRSDDDDRTPPERPDTTIATTVNSWEPLPLDPRHRWPIYLGCIRIACEPADSASKRRMSADLRSRRFVGLRACRVQSPEGKVVLTLGERHGDSHQFSVGFPGQASASGDTKGAISEEPTFVIEEALGVRLDHDATIQGSVGLDSGPLVFHGPADVPSEPGWRCYRYTDPDDGSDELRLEIGPGTDDFDKSASPSSSAKRGIIFGCTSGDSGKFEPLMSVLADRTVTVHGDLHVTGKVNPAYDPLGGLALTEAAEQTLKSAGIAAESGDLARQAAEASPNQSAPPSPDAPPPPKTRLQKLISAIKDAKKTPLAIALILGTAVGHYGSPSIGPILERLQLPSTFQGLMRSLGIIS
jgi:hypothetical protein